MPLLEAAAIMAGGRGSRFGSPAKLLQEVCGRPLIMHAIDSALSVAKLALLVVSPLTRDLMARLSVPASVSMLETPGSGFAEDLGVVLRALRPRPLIVMPGDLYGLTADVLKGFIDDALRAPEPVVTGTLGGIPMGVGLFKDSRDSPWTNVELRPDGALININTEVDLDLARRLC